MQEIPLTALYEHAQNKRQAQFDWKMPTNRYGIVALGGNLTHDTLIEAYSKGIFPWFEQPPISWYSPQKRLVLAPENFHLTRSFKKWYQQHKTSLTTSADTVFPAVIHACAATNRSKQNGGTWIGREMLAAYHKLHMFGVAHSIEIWEQCTQKPARVGTETIQQQATSVAETPKKVLIGGLYGVALGRMFFGESMFSKRSNASKLALYLLTRFLRTLAFIAIDCQVITHHLLSLGATIIPKAEFIRLLKRSNQFPTFKGNWSDLWEQHIGGHGQFLPEL